MRAPRVPVLASVVVAVGAVGLAQLPAVAVPAAVAPPPSPVVAGGVDAQPSALSAPSALAGSPSASASPSSAASSVPTAGMLAPVDPPPAPRVPESGSPVVVGESAARAQAKRLGAPVELSERRTATSSTYVDGSGMTTLRAYAAPVHVQKGGVWVVVDTTLAPAGAGLTPKATPDSVVVSSGTPVGAAAAALAPGASAAASTDLLPLPLPGTGGLTVGWGGPLPAATLRGGTATFAQARPGVDVRVDVRRSSTEFSAGLADRAHAPAVLRFPLRAPGMSFSPDGHGALEARLGGAGPQIVVATIAPALMWDAQTAEGAAARPTPPRWR